MFAYFGAVEDAATVTLNVTHDLETRLSSMSLTLFRALHTMAVEEAAKRGYAPGVSEVVFFCPVEAVALAIGCHRATIYRALPELVEAGLVDYRAHRTTGYRRKGKEAGTRGTMADGTVWSVRLRPVGNRKARVGYHDLKAKYRDLTGDIKAGRTVWAMMRQSKTQDKKPGVDLSYIRRWSLSPTQQTPVTVDCRTTARPDLEAVFGVPHADRSERSKVVSLAAEALATALRDRDGTNFYRRLLWQLLRRFDATGADHFQAVYLAAVRASVDSQEGFARNPGGLFVSRLKTAPWWDELARASGPVGSRPLQS